MQIDYDKLLLPREFKIAQDVYQYFWDEVTTHWTGEYTKVFPKHGEIFLQTFEGYAFLLDMIWPDDAMADVNNELPEPRVISFFGITTINVNEKNRRRMARGWGKTSEAFGRFGVDYDKGHFIAHTLGSPVDMNIFPQKRSINRGWCEEGKTFRAMERAIQVNPGTFVFSRPIYNDLTVCPFQLEYGYFDRELKLQMKIFSNR
jgi:hypothetical protein